MLQSLFKVEEKRNEEKATEAFLELGQQKPPA